MKACDSCEYRKYCAMSEIVNGCSRFKKDETTNEQWIRRATTEQLAEEVYKLVWCSNELFQQLEYSGIDTKENDLKIVLEWLKQPHTTE